MELRIAAGPTLVYWVLRNLKMIHFEVFVLVLFLLSPTCHTNVIVNFVTNLNIFLLF